MSSSEAFGSVARDKKSAPLMYRFCNKKRRIGMPFTTFDHCGEIVIYDIACVLEELASNNSCGDLWAAQLRNCGHVVG